MAAFGAPGSPYDKTTMQSLPNSCAAAAACNLVRDENGRMVSEAYAASKIALDGGFSVTLFDTTGIDRDQVKAGVIPFLADYGISAKVSALTGTDFSNSNLSRTLNSGAPFMLRTSSAITPGHYLELRFDSGAQVFRVNNSASGSNYTMTPAEVWNAAKYMSPGGSYLERVVVQIVGGHP